MFPLNDLSSKDNTVRFILNKVTSNTESQDKTHELESG
ncbi:DUF5503 domain-containing protein [Escherichia coli]|nr:DUF5503 domain-containing protein [Escherichia coli]WCQ55437.1 DUF5503 domain-containing protein [Escherichia coli]